MFRHAGGGNYPRPFGAVILASKGSAAGTEGGFGEATHLFLKCAARSW